MELSHAEIKELVKNEIRDALAFFIERQKLVAQAMIEMGLDLDEIGEYGALAWTPRLYSQTNQESISVDTHQPAAKSNKKLQKLLEIMNRASEKNLMQKGIWRDNEQNEWRYFLHGGGCRLINLKTSEPIDWDCPDINAYDMWKFKFHLEWQRSAPERAKKFVATNRWGSDYLEQILEEIKNDDSNRAL